MKTRPDVEKELRRWLASHHGVIGRNEALRLGASPETIRRKLANGEWVPMHRGVYRDSAVPQTPYQALRAACVATRGTAVVSHRSAGWLWHLLPTAPTRPELTIRAGAGNGRRIGGLTIHRSTDLDLGQASTQSTILVTNPLRTLVDLAACVPSVQLTGALDEALARRLVSLDGLVAELERLGRRGRPGVGALRWHLHDRGFIGVPAASVLEARMLRLIAAAGLPLPTVELQLGEHGEYRLDFAWADIRLTIEVDGYVWHFSPEQHQRDLRRRNRIQEAGWTLRIYTWRDACQEPARVASEIVATYNRLAQMPTTPS